LLWCLFDFVFKRQGCNGSRHLTKNLDTRNNLLDVQNAESRGYAWTLESHCKHAISSDVGNFIVAGWDRWVGDEWALVATSMDESAIHTSSLRM
jgi:hypothetical protein